MAIATIINQKQNLLSWKILFSQTVPNNKKPFFPVVIKNLRGVKSKEMTKVTHINFSSVSLSQESIKTIDLHNYREISKRTFTFEGYR